MLRESVLLVCLTREESDCIRSLLSSFEIEVKYTDVCPLPDAEPSLCDADTCMVILHADENRKKAEQEIRRIRNALCRPVPILVLIDPASASEIKHYLRSGADDYWVLPLDESSFPVRFYVLFEWGQAVVQTQTEVIQKGDIQEENDEAAADTNLLWHSVLKSLREGLRFFSPKSPIRSHPKSPLTHVHGSEYAKWERIRLLGAGGFGAVWLVRERGRDAALAVAKIPHSPDMNIKALRSAAILKRLIRHPHIVQLIEVFKEEGKIILIQEYVSGKTVQELLDSGMDAEKKEKAFLELLSAVSYSHEHRVIHRDIKPENMILTHSGVLKLLDFGLAADLSARNADTSAMGSLPFMAPEHIRGKSCIASDVWALGVMLYLLSARCLPFSNESESYLMDSILEMPPVSPRCLEPGLSEKLEAIILKALEKDISKRYRNAGELNSDLLKAFPDFGKGNVLTDG